MNANLYTLLETGFPADRDSCCIETSDGRFYSWRDLERASAKMANLLSSLDLAPNSRIAAQVDKSPEALFLYLATLRAGYIYLPLNTAYQEAEVAYFIGDAEPAVVVCTPRNFGWVAQIAFKAGTQHVFTLGQHGHDKTIGSLLTRATPQPDHYQTVNREPQDLAAILYTSGTTGRSKGAMLSHANLASNALVLQQTWHWQAGDVLLHALPIFHIHGLFVAVHGALLNGSKMIFLTRFDAAEVIRHLPRASVFMGVPTYYVRLLAESSFNRTVCARMRLFISGSAPLATETFNQFTERCGHTILERYGMSETAMLTSNPYQGARMAGTVGLPLDGVSVRVVQDDAACSTCAVGQAGAVQVKGPNVFQGYWRMPEKTAEEFTADGYFKTGDIGAWNEQGYLSIVGRGKDLIISGGYNIYPKEIELLIDALPGVLESAVIGIPDADYGEAVAAIVIARAGAKLNPAAIIDTLKSQVAHFKVPKQVFLQDELPRNAMGKVQKNLLRARYKPA